MDGYKECILGVQGVGAAQLTLGCWSRNEKTKSVVFLEKPSMQVKYR